MAQTTPKRTLCGLAVLLAGAVYLNALRNPFVYDDHRAIVDNVSIRDLSSVWALVFAHVFRPIVNVSYALDFAVWGLEPFGYHLTNLLLHMANVALLFRLTWLGLGDWQARAPEATASAGPREAIAFTAAALFGVHPMMTESVGYVSGRAEVLCGLFFLLGLLAVRRALLGDRLRWLWASLGLTIAGLASKEVAAMLPLVAVGYDRLLLDGSAAARRRRLWRVHVPLLTVVVLAGAARAAAFLWIETQPPPVPAWRYALMELSVVWRYLFLLLAPLSQSVVHSVREVTTPFDPQALLAAVGLAALCVLAFRIRRRDPLVALGVAWFFLLLVPSSSLVPLNEAMAEHRVYLASGGFFLAVAAGWGRLPGWLGRHGVPSRVLPRAALALGLCALSVLTVARNLVWADPVTLWLDAARKAPDVWLPHYALADALRARGNCPDAIPAYQTALRLRPQELLVYTNLGACLMDMGRFADAEGILSSALRIDPRFVRVHNNLGVLALLTGHPERARGHFIAALTHDPRHVPSRLNLAALYETTYGDPAEALRLCREIQGIAPHTAGVGECIRRNQGRLGPPAPRS